MKTRRKQKKCGNQPYRQIVSDVRFQVTFNENSTCIYVNVFSCKKVWFAVFTRLFKFTWSAISCFSRTLLSGSRVRTPCRKRVLFAYIVFLCTLMMTPWVKLVFLDFLDGNSGSCSNTNHTLRDGSRFFYIFLTVHFVNCGITKYNLQNGQQKYCQYEIGKIATISLMWTNNNKILNSFKNVKCALHYEEKWSINIHINATPRP